MFQENLELLKEYIETVQEVVAEHPPAIVYQIPQEVISKYDIAVLITTLTLEAGGEKDYEESMKAVLNVIANRADRIPKNYAKEALEYKQFSMWNKANAGKISKEAVIKKGLAHPHADVAKKLVYKLLNKNLNDNTNGSEFYYAKRLDDIGKTPSWVHDKGMKFVQMIGNHKFYKQNT